MNRNPWHHQTEINGTIRTVISTVRFGEGYSIIEELKCRDTLNKDTIDRLKEIKDLLDRRKMARKGVLKMKTSKGTLDFGLLISMINLLVAEPKNITITLDREEVRSVP